MPLPCLMCAVVLWCSCERCGFMSSQAVCKACMLLEGLNSGLPNHGVSRTRRGHARRPQQHIQVQLEQPQQQQQQQQQTTPAVQPLLASQQQQQQEAHKVTQLDLQQQQQEAAEQGLKQLHLPVS